MEAVERNLADRDQPELVALAVAYWTRSPFPLSMSVQSSATASPARKPGRIERLHQGAVNANRPGRHPWAVAMPIRCSTSFSLSTEGNRWSRFGSRILRVGLSRTAGDFQVAEEALDSSKPALTHFMVGIRATYLRILIGRDDDLDRNVTQEAAEGGQVAAVGRDGIGRCPVDLRESGEESADFVFRIMCHFLRLLLDL